MMASRSLAPMVLSFDVEEHWRIEAARDLSVDTPARAYYAQRVAPTTRWLLEQLARCNQKATFFLVGELAHAQPDLVRDIQRGGHEIASHGWDHQRVLTMTPEEFREDLRKSKDALEQLLGEPIHGYRAPTFSIVRQTGWALDVLVEQGYTYDSSIYPVRHDRYGVPDAPRGPFWARGHTHEILELPPVRLDFAGLKVPMGGGGYFRLFPLRLTEWALRQTCRQSEQSLGMLYFHPWEFDPEQERLPLRRLNRFRTYVGLRASQQRLVRLMQRYSFTRAVDAVEQLRRRGDELPRFPVAQPGLPLADRAEIA